MQIFCFWLPFRSTVPISLLKNTHHKLLKELLKSLFKSSSCGISVRKISTSARAEIYFSNKFTAWQDFTSQLLTRYKHSRICNPAFFLFFCIAGFYAILLFPHFKPPNYSSIPIPHEYFQSRSCEPDIWSQSIKFVYVVPHPSHQSVQSSD